MTDLAATQRANWPRSAEAALAAQDRLRGLVIPTSAVPAHAVRLVAGLDVAYAKDESVVAAAVVVMEARSHRIVETATALRPVGFPYVPGLLAFRELPSLLDALDRLRTTPEVLVCDGYGLAHPRRFGLACHLGVLTALPCFGVAKSPFVGRFDEPGRQRGDFSPLLDGQETIGRVLRTQREVKPVFVSVGHRVDIEDSAALTLRLAPRFRLPETTRQADRLSRQVLADAPTTAGDAAFGR